MKYSTHVITALSVSTTLVAFDIIRAPDFSDYGLVGIANYAVFWAVIAFASLVPDIDHGNSYISNKLKIPIHYLFKHRGFTHQVWLWGVLIWLGFNNLIPHAEFAIWIGIGALLHSFGDMHTKNGVKLFGFGKRGMNVLPSFLIFRTGSPIERLFFVGYSVLFGYSISMIFS